MEIVDKIPNFAATKLYNMDIKKLMVASALLMSMTTMAQTGKGGTWTLDDCLNYAIKNNISLQKQQLSRLSAVEDVKQSQKALLPTLSANTSQMFGWRPWINDQTTTVANGTQIITELKEIESDKHDEGPQAGTERSPFAPGPPGKKK